MERVEPVGATGERPQPGPGRPADVARIPPGRPSGDEPTLRVAPTGLVSNSLGAIVDQFKSQAVKKINRIRPTPGAPVWQRGFYDRIVRGNEELEQIREYIIGNPASWDWDEENDHSGTDQV